MFMRIFAATLGAFFVLQCDTHAQTDSFNRAVQEMEDVAKQAIDESDAAYKSVQSVAGKHYTSIVTKDHLKKMPSWDDDATNPPVSAREALKSATAKCDELFPANEETVMYRESARLLLLDENNNKWIWKVSFRRLKKKKAPTFNSQSLEIIVGMDGVVISPTVR